MAGNLNRLLDAEFVRSFVAATGMEVSTRVGSLRFGTDEFALHVTPYASTNNAVTRVVMERSGLSASPHQLAVRLGGDDHDLSVPEGVDANDPMAVSVATGLRTFLTDVFPHRADLDQRFPDEFHPLPEQPSLPHYAELRISADPEIMGVDHPQINGVEGRSDVTHLDADDVALDDLLMKTGATPTDFVSCSFLAHRGLFVSPRTAERLAAFRSAGVVAHPFTVNRRYADHRRDLVHLSVEQRDLIDWAHSEFVDGRARDAGDIVRFASLDAYTEAVWAAQERADGTRVEPRSIRLTDYVDLFRFPLRGTIVVSRAIMGLVRAHGLTGCGFGELGYDVT
ncbi:hypothetical protein [Ilumatobacter coccineus]|uniref:Uncharacterized protein n=1 Tax=Ilumatobacter coccineus (strain NBRC 103263 / KCTC 29153 / YM16-304) TaxID=1313172 RepID=A0A6C7EIQ7_ILUCY|nr:hypothetical protein [Ilumatobacter coccineus]BAN03856.1 hypothetical protein YM304_35420 [Ilumatobacter coccineus YM16-304]